MRASGVVTLIGKDGGVVAANKYCNRYTRNQLVEGWKRRYGAAINKCYIQIIPNTDESLICPETGRNTIKREQFSY